jgi:hypothetical protein
MQAGMRCVLCASFLCHPRRTHARTRARTHACTQMLKRGNIERDDKEMSGSRVDGLGAADAPTHAVRDCVAVCDVVA